MFIYRCFEHFFEAFEEVFPKFEGDKLIEFLSGLKSVKNLEIACQIMKLANFSLINLEKQKDQEQIMKALEKTAIVFLNTDIVRELQQQCRSLLDFTNGGLGEVEKLNFNLQKTVDILRRKLNFCILFLQLENAFLSSEHASENEKALSVESVKSVIGTMSAVL